MLKKKLNLVLIYSLVLACFGSYAQSDLNLEFNGFADTYHAFMHKNPFQFLSSRSRLRTELKIYSDESNLFASINSIHNSLMDDETKIELREVYFEYSFDEIDLKVGRQIITWGVADAVRLTDIISPMDYTEFLARDYDDIRIPVNALKMVWTKVDYNFEFVLVPVHEYFVIPTNPNNPWSLTNSIETNYVVHEHKNQTNLKNIEFGGKLSFYLNGIDFSISALQTYTKMPVYQNRMISDTLVMDAFYDRMTMFGFDLSKTVGNFVLRSEFALYLDELQQNKQTFLKPINSNAYNALLGVDWYPGNDWTISGQYYHKYIQESAIWGNQQSAMAILNFRKKLMNNNLALSSFAYWDISNRSVFNRLISDYALNDQIHFMIGYDFFHGKEGIFANYKDNSEIWVKAKYNF